MKKIFIIIVCLIFWNLSVLAKEKAPNWIINEAITQSNISKTALISTVFKEVDSKKIIVQYNPNVPMSVASVQKIVTTIPALEKLGTNYKFKTQILKDNNKNFYIKLGADPYFTTDILNNMVEKINDSIINKVYIDDSITDRIEWGEGWQWDNTFNSYMPKFSAYNIDSNRMSIIVKPTTEGAPADVYTSVFYPMTFENNVVTGDKNDLKFEGINYVYPDFIRVSGIVNTRQEKVIPINDLRKYFILRLKNAFKNNKIAYYGNFERKIAANNSILVAEYTSPIEKVLYDILQKSDNMMIETLFKISGGGSTENAIKMFKEYYEKQNISTDGIKITDASGVSKNNLLNANFITDVLISNYNSPNSIKKYMPYPGVGTLTNRMYYLKDNLIAKTGTLQNVSAIAGYLTSKKGKVYSFCIIIQDAKSTDNERKAFEEYLLRLANNIL